MSDETIQQLEAQVGQLQEENRELRAALEKAQRASAMKKAAKSRLMSGGWRLLVPLLDRQRVVRSFGKLAETAGDFTGPTDEWPTRDKVLGDAREFLESCTRFVIRRRMFFLIFSLLATTIPAIQIWLVFQQNAIIENQNKFFEIQVYDVVARSMTEGDRNARRMTGALLSNADPEFLRGVIEESFNPEMASVRLAGGVADSRRQLEDAGFRGYLVGALVGSVKNRADENSGELFETSQPMFRRVFADAQDRVPGILRLTRSNAEAPQEVSELDHQVAAYLDHLGRALRIDGRLARAAGEEDAYYSDIKPLLRRIAGRRTITDSRFGEFLQTVLADFLIELSLELELEDSMMLDVEDADVESTLRDGLSTLREELGDDALNWSNLSQHAGVP